MGGGGGEEGRERERKGKRERDSLNTIVLKSSYCSTTYAFNGNLNSPDEFQTLPVIE